MNPNRTSLQVTNSRVDLPHERIAEFCQRNHIQFLALFGSVLSDRFGPESDVDVLVEFEPGHTPGLALIRMEDELSRLLEDRPVDLVTARFLHPRIRERVLAEMEPQFIHG